ncbi:dicarboxylate/amino acid:cation symporter [Amycolatopsis pigmentata]|uniref:Dicarboxylate/amino acid:cation symporter n=1 Tax=Amycolatopsis pigmentata TaxID=450801 RepID=A0ABW5FNK3_9PSEU
MPLSLQAGVAVAAGVGVGLANRQLGLNLQVLGTVFVNLIEVVIVPLMLPLIILAIATMESTRALGRLAGKAILYFEVATTVILLLGLAIANLTEVGQSASLPSANTAKLSTLQHGVDFKSLILTVFPSNIVQAMSSGNLLALLVFGGFVGVGLAALGEKAAPVKNFLDSLAQTMFKVMGYIIKLTPLGVFGLMAYASANYGVSTLVSLLGFLGVLYFGFAVVIFGLFPLAGLAFGIRYWHLFRHIFPVSLIAFLSRSTEVALPPLLEKLDSYGVSRKTYSFTVPLGYSFNTSGACMYQAVAVLFIAHAYHVPMSFGHQVSVVLVLMLLTKGIAAVPSASIVTLLATATAVGLPPEGVAILLAIDFFADMPRTSVNVIGDALASVILDRSEGTFSGPARRAGRRRNRRVPVVAADQAPTGRRPDAGRDLASSGAARGEGLAAGGAEPDPGVA